MKLLRRHARLISIVLVAATPVVWIAWDILPGLVWPEAGDTESEVIRDAAWYWPTVALAWGVVSGHLFLSRRGAVLTGWATVVAISVAVAVSTVLTLVGVSRHPGYDLVAGVAVGCFAWGQRPPTKGR